MSNWFCPPFQESGLAPHRTGPAPIQRR